MIRIDFTSYMQIHALASEQMHIQNRWTTQSVQDWIVNYHPQQSMDDGTFSLSSCPALTQILGLISRVITIIEVDGASYQLEILTVSKVLVPVSLSLLFVTSRRHSSIIYQGFQIKEWCDFYWIWMGPKRSSVNKYQLDLNWDLLARLYFDRVASIASPLVADLFCGRSGSLVSVRWLVALKSILWCQHYCMLCNYLVLGLFLGVDGPS